MSLHTTICFVLRVDEYFNHCMLTSLKVYVSMHSKFTKQPPKNLKGGPVRRPWIRLSKALILMTHGMFALCSIDIRIYSYKEGRTTTKCTCVHACVIGPYAKLNVIFTF